MAKTKIVVKLQLHSDKQRKKAMKIASVTDGVSSVAIKGADKIEVTGEEVDSVELTNCLRKKVCCHATIELVEAVKDKDKDAEEKNKQLVPIPWHFYSNYPPYPSVCMAEAVDPNPSGCFIL